MKRILKFVLLVICMFLGLVSCSSFAPKNQVKIERDESSSQNERSIEIDLEKRIENIVFSWYKKNHYEYKEKNEQKYTFRIVDKDASIYGRKCYLVVMYFNGKQYMDFAVDIKDCELYLCYEDNLKFIPVKSIMLLDASKYEKEIKKTTNYLKRKCDINNIVFCDTVMRLQKEYFVFAEYTDMEIQTMYLIDANSDDIYTWDLKNDVLNPLA